MANPQKENGHIGIANEIVEHLCYYRLSGQEYQILWVIIRKTWGWKKKEDWISLSQFYQLTKIKKPSIIKTINKLLDKNIISKKANENSILYSFNKDFDTWKALAKRLIVSKKANGVSKKANGVSKKANKSLAKRLPTIDNYTIETITKETFTKSEQSSRINEYLNAFYKINPTINFGNMTYRKTLEELEKKFGYEKLKNTIEYAIVISSQKYAPTITNPIQLKNKLGDLLLYYKKNNKENLTLKI